MRLGYGLWGDSLKMGVELWEWKLKLVCWQVCQFFRDDHTYNVAFNSRTSQRLSQKWENVFYETYVVCISDQNNTHHALVQVKLKHKQLGRALWKKNPCWYPTMQRKRKWVKIMRSTTKRYRNFTYRWQHSAALPTTLHTDIRDTFYI